MIVTDDDALYDRIWSFKDHGKDRALVFAPDPPPGFRWLHSAGPGTNLRMTGLSAAIGRVQLRRLPEWQALRAANAARLARALRGSDLLRIPQPPQGLTHAMGHADHLAVVLGAGGAALVIVAAIALFRRLRRDRP